MAHSKPMCIGEINQRVLWRCPCINTLKIKYSICLPQFVFQACSVCGLVFRQFEGHGVEEHITCYDDVNHDVIQGTSYYDIGSGYPFVPRSSSPSTSAPPFVMFPGTGPLVHGETLIMHLDKSDFITFDEINREILRYLKQNSVTKVIRLFFIKYPAKKSSSRWRANGMPSELPPYQLLSLAKLRDIEIAVSIMPNNGAAKGKLWTTKDPGKGFKTWAKIFL
jgi:hypothetical protein